MAQAAGLRERLSRAAAQAGCYAVKAGLRRRRWH